MWRKDQHHGQRNFLQLLKSSRDQTNRAQIKEEELYVFFTSKFTELNSKITIFILNH